MTYCLDRVMNDLVDEIESDLQEYVDKFKEIRYRIIKEMTEKNTKIEELTKKYNEMKEDFKILTSSYLKIEKDNEQLRAKLRKLKKLLKIID